ncbi:hypothetical protein C8R44DRAFT_198017 [Mycena epipterygia]|nr:hypothetical protein C8R44DRAFT_198017 [Mycena epipterygia]
MTGHREGSMYKEFKRVIPSLRRWAVPPSGCCPSQRTSWAPSAAALISSWSSPPSYSYWEISMPNPVPPRCLRSVICFKGRSSEMETKGRERWKKMQRRLAWKPYHINQYKQGLSFYVCFQV